MIRIYDGSISGQFWYGIQNSDDASFFGVLPNNKYYCVCNCICNYTINKYNKYYYKDNYCKCCFNSYEEHIEHIKKKYNISLLNTYYISNKKISFTFTKSHINILKEKIEILKNKIEIYIEKYQINNIGCEEIPIYQYEYNLCNNPKYNDLKLLSRYFLGKLILYCVEINDVCIFNCSLL